MYVCSMILGESEPAQCLEVDVSIFVCLFVCLFIYLSIYLFLSFYLVN